MGDRSATAAVAAELAEAAGANVPAPAEQLDFLPTRFVDAEEGDRRARARRQVAEHRRGRPPGAQNIATRQMLDFCRRVYGDPVMDTFRWAQHTPASLAEELGCSKLEAFDRLDAMRARLERLFYATRAPVDGDGNAVAPVFSMTVGGQAGADERPPWLRGQGQQNQGLIDVTPGVSHAAVSHDGDK